MLQILAFIKKTYYLFIFIFVSSCANMIPPSGGPRDSLPPILINAAPKDSTINFNSKKITLTFNEYVEVKEIQQNLLINPVQKTQPIIDYKLNNVFITLKDSLEPNTTYNINFGNSIKDINEGNVAKNTNYVFSTGSKIDNNYINGNIVLAKDGKIDSTLIVVLHSNLSDTAILKHKPKYVSKLDGLGNFEFNNLPNILFNVFVLPNDFSKKYDDSTKLFGFLNYSVLATDSTFKSTIYAFKEKEVIVLNKQNELNSGKEDKKLKYLISTNLNKYDINDTTFNILFNKEIKISSTEALMLLDSNNKKVEKFSFYIDSNFKTIVVKNKLVVNANYSLIIDKEMIHDTLNNKLSKTDTIKISAFKESDYGKLKIKLNNIGTNAVLQILKDGRIINSITIKSKEIKLELFKPGEYDVAILIDENKNGVWDTGNYKLKLQPEKVISLSTKLIVKANWDNVIDINW